MSAYVYFIRFSVELFYNAGGGGERGEKKKRSVSLIYPANAL